MAQLLALLGRVDFFYLDLLVLGISSLSLGHSKIHNCLSAILFSPPAKSQAKIACETPLKIKGFAGVSKKTKTLKTGIKRSI